jgi:hypothetical protein
MNTIPDEFRNNHIDIVNLDVPYEQKVPVGLYRNISGST